MKKAFTLSEALITLAIIGVLAAILIPAVDNVRPDKDKVTYKKALYSMQVAVSTAMETSVYDIASNSAAYWKDANVGESDFCTALAEALNTVGRVDCVSPSSYDSPNFITSDGIRYWNLEGKVFNDENPVREVCVDRQLSSGEQSKILAKRGKDSNDVCDGGMKIQVRYDGKVTTPESSDYDFENDLIENSMSVVKGKPEGYK